MSAYLVKKSFERNGKGLIAELVRSGGRENRG